MGTLDHSNSARAHSKCTSMGLTRIEGAIMAARTFPARTMDHRTIMARLVRRHGLLNLKKKQNESPHVDLMRHARCAGGGHIAVIFTIAGDYSSLVAIGSGLTVDNRQTTAILDI